MTKTDRLPPELRALVKQAVAELGDIIRRELGAPRFRLIEGIRQDMASLRDLSEDRQDRILRRTLTRLKRLPSAERWSVAHAFTLMLETMNACEQAYRTLRLRENWEPRFERADSTVIYVLTAHPTEARAPANIGIFQKLQTVLQEALKDGYEAKRREIRHLLELAWAVSVTRQRRPRVEDEIEYVHSVVLSEGSIETILGFNARLGGFYLRSWVGGDKDGHPYVNEKTMEASLKDSRRRLARYAQAQARAARDAVRLSGDARLEGAMAKLLERLAEVANVRDGDGARVARLRDQLAVVEKAFAARAWELPPQVEKIRRLLHAFPALVLSLELRESSDEIWDGNPTIARMLEKLHRIAKGARPRWYARGLIVSNTRRVEDLQVTAKLVERVFGAVAIPVLPLFEDHDSLGRSAGIITDYLKKPGIRRAMREHWGDLFEIMVGYSDSAKESGVLSSRVSIARAIDGMTRACRGIKARPVFFHGSGGSVDRGGGSVEEQTAWLPPEGLELYKSTIQGEMIARLFSSPEILGGGLRRVFEMAAQPRSRAAVKRDSAVVEFAELAARNYRWKVSDPEFLDLIRRATPYSYLSVLRIGSRPSARKKEFSLKSLRAIPWVLCWTQTRVLFPTWWGVGRAWKEAGVKERQQLARAYSRDFIFGSYVKALGFTLAKVELGVWRLYLETAGLSQDRIEDVMAEFRSEMRAAADFVCGVSGQKRLLWFRPWLEESIRLRSPMIHPLNLLQILALKEKDVALLRETVAGISSGMMTTG